MGHQRNVSRLGNCTERTYRILAEPPERAALDTLPPKARAAQPRNFLRHGTALGLTKSADGLIDPKLVLSWLMTHLGAPAAMIGLLVPIREAGALLPQLFTAEHIRSLAQRKWAWVGASFGQAAGVAIMLLAALTTTRTTAGALILLGLALLAVSRSVASVAHKDVLGATIAEGQRGTVMGLATSLSAVVVIGFALVLIGFSDARVGIVLMAMALAALAWGLAGLIFAGVVEDRNTAAPGNNGARAALANLRYLREDPELARFVLARGLLTSTALAPPYLVMLASGESEAALTGLGALVLASASAALVSGYVWGRLADRSSRRVLMLTGVTGSLAMALVLVFAALGLSASAWTMPLALFLLMLAHHGVRVGRSTYLLDMARSDRRAIYTAIANTVIGVILLASGLFGAVAALLGAEVTLVLFALMALAGALVARGLKELNDG